MPDDIEKSLLAHIVNIAPNSIIVHDFDGKMLYANEKTFEMHGYKKDEFMALNLHEIDIPESEKLIARRMELIKKNGEAVFEASHFRKDGSTFLIEVYVKKIQWGGTPAMLSIATDITERKRAEEALKESEERYKFLAENMGDMVWLLDSNMKTTYISPSIVKLLGVTPEERMGQSLDEMLTPESYSMVMELYRREIRRDTEKDVDPDRDLTFDVEYYHKDGHTVWMENRVRALRNKEGSITGIYGISRDITDRRRAEVALKESEHRYRTIFEETANPILIIDDRGNYIDSNQAGLLFLECSREELLKKNVIDFMRHRTDEEIHVLMKKHRSLWVNGGTIETDHFVNGKIKNLFLNITPGVWRGKPVVFGVGSDITGLKQAREEISRQLREKEFLLKEVHHRIKNNINSISNLMSLQMDAAVSNETAASL